MKDERLEEFLKKYSHIKETGIKCNSDASIDFYKDVLAEVEEYFINDLAQVLINVKRTQGMDGYYDKESLELMNENFILVEADMKIYYDLQELITNLNLEPERYDCWVDYIDNEEVFYVEKKQHNLMSYL